jgi:SAM-dependent methyltransferase
MTRSLTGRHQRRRLRLFLLSFLMLFVELALIRWAGSNVVYLSYFSNFLLLGSFLGVGIGFLRAKAKRDLFPWAAVALAGVVAFVLLFPVEIDRSGSQVIYFGNFQSSGLPMWLVLPLLFAAAAGVMALIAEGVARTFKLFDPLEAYRLDILGSVAGIAAFTLLSFLHAPPVLWGMITGILFLVLYQPALKLVQVAAVLAIVLMLADESLERGDSWSPYYKVTVTQEADDLAFVNVNGIPHQAISTSERRAKIEPAYFVPFDRVETQGRDVLIVGAGTGSDVAIALANGARHVDAVEIDPRLYEIGNEINPERPYADDRVAVHIDDGRSFLERTDRRYDLILFALPDSLTLVSGQASLRLESYLFTRDAMVEARNHLKPSGAFSMYNFYREEWLIDRLANTLAETYGHRPCLDSFGTAGRMAVLTVGRQSDSTECDSRWAPTGSVVAPATDDHPFLYLRGGFPNLYLITVALILFASVIAVRISSGPLARMGSYLDLFFMGAAFLLIETKSVVQFALFFGTTWLVNALVFGGILLSVLAAIEVVRRVPALRPRTLYGVLFASLLVAWAVPPRYLLDLPVGWRFVAAAALAFAPILVANLIFAQRFKHVESSTTAFGANLLGAMVGGVLEYASLLVGYRNLVIASALLYALAYYFGRRVVARDPTAATRPAVAAAPS